MPAACDAGLREELLARVWVPTARAATRQDAELAAELETLEALEAAGDWGPPATEELCGLDPDPDCGPPDGADAWLADLPSELLAEYLAATEDPPCREPIVAGRLPRQPGGGCGFAGGGAADEMPPGAVLAGLAGDAWAGGLGRLSDDELIGMLRAARRLASWSAALELAAVADLAGRREAEAETAGACVPGEHIGDEIAAALTLTGRPADVLLDLALALRRLPVTMAALATGRIDRYKAAVIADEVAGLGDEHAGAVEREVLDHAPARPPASCAPPPAMPCWPPTRPPPASARSAPSAMPGSRGGTSTPAPPPWPAGICPLPRCWPPIRTFLPWPARSGGPG
jgi:hypothetical protein